MLYESMHKFFCAKHWPWNLLNSRLTIIVTKTLRTSRTPLAQREGVWCLIHQHSILTIPPAATTVSKMYILCCTLDTAVIEQTALSHECLLEEKVQMTTTTTTCPKTMTASLPRVPWINTLLLACSSLHFSQSGTIPSNAQSTHHSMQINTFL